MIGLTANIWSHNSAITGKRFTPKEVLQSDPLDMRTFRNLVRAVAQVSYHNPEHVLFFRGQGREHHKKTREGGRVNSFYPSIYRSPGGSLSEAEVEKRFQTLDVRSAQLLSLFNDREIVGHDKLGKFPELVWAILQHYEVCPTPLLDVTHSLRVAASFALNGTDAEGFLFVFGFPHPNGSITYSVENELINIRLLSTCPPDAQRPYFQEGFLVGSFPSKRLRKHPNLDVGVRLMAKYRLVTTPFWDHHFQAIPEEALFPPKDKVGLICKEVSQMSIDDLTKASIRLRRKFRSR